MPRWQDESVDRYSPSVRRRRLGRALRTLREARSLSGEQAAKDLGLSPSQLSKIETADRSLSRPALMGILGYYKATDRDIAELTELHASARDKGWFQATGAQQGAWVDWASEAVKIQAFEPLLFPGPMQIEPYAEAVIAASQPDLPDVQRAQWTATRTAQAGLLDNPPRDGAWFIIGESAFRTVGSGLDPVVLRAQIDRVRQVAALPNITVQVLRFEDGVHTSMSGAFSVLTFEDLPPLGAVEHLITTAWFERQSQVNTLTTAFGRLSAQALGARETLDWLEALE
jgi:transcriptional regulator with XRE-family HTH domain